MVFDHIALALPNRCNEICEWIHLWHMPVSFLLSGLVLNSEKYLSWKFFSPFLKSRVKTILIPYFTFGIIYMFFSYFSINVLELNGTTVSLIDRIKGFWWNNNPDHPSGMYWFLSSLFLTESTFVIITNCLGKRKIGILLYIVLLILGFVKISKFGITLPLALDTLPFTLLFFAIGFHFKDFFINSKCSRSAIYLAIGLLLLSIIYFYSPLHFGINMCTCWYSSWFVIFISLILILSIITCTKMLVLNNSLQILLSSVGKNTLVIYCLNFMVIKMVCTLLSSLSVKRMIISDIISIVITGTYTILVIFIIQVSCKVFPKTTSVLSGKF